MRRALANSWDGFGVPGRSERDRFVPRRLPPLLSGGAISEIRGDPPVTNEFPASRSIALLAWGSTSIFFFFPVRLLRPLPTMMLWVLAV